MYAVGIGRIDVGELREIASDPDDEHVFILRSYLDAAGFVDFLSVTTCDSKLCLSCPSCFKKHGLLPPHSLTTHTLILHTPSSSTHPHPHPPHTHILILHTPSSSSSTHPHPHPPHTLILILHTPTPSSSTHPHPHPPPHILILHTPTSSSSTLPYYILILCPLSSLAPAIVDPGDNTTTEVPDGGIKYFLAKCPAFSDKVLVEVIDNNGTSFLYCSAVETNPGPLTLNTIRNETMGIRRRTGIVRLPKKVYY